MAVGSWRTDGCDNRAVRRCLVEPPCEECCWRARQRVADQLAGEGRPQRAACASGSRVSRANKKPHWWASVRW